MATDARVRLTTPDARPPENRPSCPPRCHAKEFSVPSEVKIAAEPRTEFGKGAARRIRRANKVPAVLYGHGTDPVHITLPGHDLMLALKTANALLSIELAGNSQLALPKQVQRDPIKGFIEHADLLIVRQGEKVTVDVPVLLLGEAAPDTMVSLESPSVSLEVEATHIPQGIEVDITGLTAGSQIHAADLVLPDGATLSVSGDPMIVNISAQQSQEALEAELADAEADLGVERDEPEAAAEAPEVAAEGAEADQASDV
jgi:large subunit ribosomal protein L25